LLAAVAAPGAWRIESSGERQVHIWLAGPKNWAAWPGCRGPMSSVWPGW
jgi:hypothetical protein